MKKLEVYLKDNPHAFLGKTVAVSGATGGLGRELCKRLCELGASLILLDRNKERSLALIGELSLKYEGAKLEHITLDLEDMERVREVAEQLLCRELDFLVLNAGAYAIPRHKCSTGYDNVFQINFVSPYFLARTLLPSIKERGGKVVAVGSIAHNYSKIDPEDIDFSTRHAASKVYGNAKRHLMFSLWELDGYIENISITHPGIAVTNITAHYPKLIYALIKYPMKLIFDSPRKACRSILYGLFVDCEKHFWIGPRIFNIWGAPKKQRLNTCSQAEASVIASRAERVWESWNR